MTFEEIKNGLMGKHAAYIKQSGHVMATFVIDDVLDTYGKEEIRFYGDDEDGGRHHFPLSYEQAEELINNGEYTVCVKDPWRPTKKPKPLWGLILSQD